jgi:hypothetical protein
MASGFTNYASTIILNSVLAGQPRGTLTTWYLAGFKVAPTAAGGGTESTYTNYARVAIAANGANFPNATGTSTVQVANGAAFLFPAAGAGTSESWTALGLFDAPTGGNLWTFYPCSASLTASTVIQVGIGELVTEIVLNTNGGLTTYGAQQILNGYLRRSAFSPPSNWYLAGYTANPTIAGGGTESTRTGYARVLIPADLTDWPSASGTNPITQSNGNTVNFNPLGGSGTETWLGWSLNDALTAGNSWMFGLLSGLVVGNGSQVQFPVGSLQEILTSTTP